MESRGGNTFTLNEAVDTSMFASALDKDIAALAMGASELSEASAEVASKNG